ncbi:MAG: signal peptidase I, partial [Oscillospiraceae bacterium]|nr:signal peptidase I [Oscillospiraceae bacterium]
MNNKTKEKGDIRLHRWISTVVTILLVLAVVFCLYSVIQVLSKGYVNIGGFMMFRVVTGSMEPTMPIGTLLITREVDIETVMVNDIVCFRTQVSEIWGKIVTHRVVDIMESGGGILLETKGDANLASDIFYVDSSNFVGKVIWHSGDDNVLADLVSLFTSKVGFLGCIALPSLILAALILKNSVGNIRHELLMVME